MAQMVAFLQRMDDNGEPLSGALLYFYETLTTTPLSIYQDAAFGTPAANPAVADAAGAFEAVYLAEPEFKVVLKTAAGVTVETIDPYLMSFSTDADADSERARLGVGPYVASRTLLKALDTTLDKAAYLMESGRNGWWTWTTGDFSAAVTADASEWNYIKADAIATTVGAWVRAERLQDHTVIGSIEPLAGHFTTVEGTIGTFSTKVSVPSGSAAAPSFDFTPAADSANGFYKRSANFIGVSIAGAYAGGFTGATGGRSPSIFWGKAAWSSTSIGVAIEDVGFVEIVRSDEAGLRVCRITTDGTLVLFEQDGVNDGSISTLAGTVSYNALLASHWSQLADGSKPEILLGTICESIDQMCEWKGLSYTDHEGNSKVAEAAPKGSKVGDIFGFSYDRHENGPDDEDGNPTSVLVSETVKATVIDLDNTRLPCFKISDTPGSKSVYGFFLGWDNDDKRTNDAYIAAVGDGWIRIAKGETVVRGDLIESNGDGCGRVQKDDLFHASTVGKVLAAIVVATYPDGSYLVPCSIHCG